MSIEKLKELKMRKDFSMITDTILDALLDSTIELLEQNQAQEVSSAARKWEPLSEGYVMCYFDGKPNKITCVDRKLVDYGMVCETEQDAIDKHKLLRSVSRLDSVIREYGEYKFQINELNYYLVFDHYKNSYGINCNDVYQGIGVIYHTRETMEDVCRRLNDGEIEL